LVISCLGFVLLQTIEYKENSRRTSLFLEIFWTRRMVFPAIFGLSVTSGRQRRGLIPAYGNAIGAPFPTTPKG
jgi:hypothetical protein